MRFKYVRTPRYTYKSASEYIFFTNITKYYSFIGILTEILRVLDVNWDMDDRLNYNSKTLQGPVSSCGVYSITWRDQQPQGHGNNLVRRCFEQDYCY